MPQRTLKCLICLKVPQKNPRSTSEKPSKGFPDLTPNPPKLPNLSDPSKLSDRRKPSEDVEVCKDPEDALNAKFTCLKIFRQKIPLNASKRFKMPHDMLLRALKKRRELETRPHRPHRPH